MVGWWEYNLKNISVQGTVRAPGGDAGGIVGGSLDGGTQLKSAVDVSGGGNTGGIAGAGYNVSRSYATGPVRGRGSGTEGAFGQENNIEHVYVVTNLFSIGKLCRSKWLKRMDLRVRPESVVGS